MTTNIDRAAEILHRHHDNCNDAADALDAAGVLAPDLPKPRIISRRGALGAPRAEWGLGFDTVIADGPHVWCGGYMEEITPAGARALGLALLAAADHAEEVKA